MATPDNETEQRMQVDGEGNESLLSESSDSENDLSGNEEAPPKTEWLATGREKRSTAGNRMKSMIAAEEPDDELELLFAEDADDAGFTDIEEDGSDAQMSSSEDEDAQDNADELEGEKELEKQARESRQATRKRKAQEAIPLKFRKKVKIDTSHTPSASATPAPKPRPRKKSERISWLPSPADMPTRASKRETTMAGKEQLHKQMAEREVKRLKQIEAMERKAKKMEALKKPPMTQAERLAEAALVEKRNAKSLNRWEEAEKQREEERKAKLAALNNRTLEGPVVTFWSGVGEWIDGKLKHVGKMVTIEEKPAKKKRHSAVGPEAAAESPREDTGQANVDIPPDKATLTDPSPPLPKETSPRPGGSEHPAVLNRKDSACTTGDTPVLSTSDGQETRASHNSVVETTSTIPSVPPGVSASQVAVASSAPDSREQDPTPSETNPPPQLPPQLPPPAHIKPPDLKPPDLQPPNAGLYTTSVFAPPVQSSLMMPPELKPPSNTFLAPPVGVSQNGLSMPMIGYHSSPSTTNSSHVLAPPNPAQRQSPLSMPQTNIPLSPSPAPTPTRPAQIVSTPKPKASPILSNTPTPPFTRPSLKTTASILKPTKNAGQRHQPKEAAPSPPPSPPANGKATRNCIILQNFNEHAIKDKTVQTRVLFNREMNKLPKQGPVVRCVITNHPARYRDPKTGLPYYNAYAFKQIRKLHSGEYKWSSLIGAWIGSGTSAAIGVPARFVDPDAPGPPKEQTPPDPPTENDKAMEGLNSDVTPQISGNHSVQVPALPVPQPSDVATPVAPSRADNNNAPSATDGPTTDSNPPVVSGSSSSTRPHVPTTAATFALDAGYVTALDPPMVGNTEPKSVDKIDNTQRTDVVQTSSSVLGVPAGTVGAPPAAVEKRAGNQ